MIRHIARAGENITRGFNSLERDRTQSRFPLFADPVASISTDLEHVAQSAQRFWDNDMHKYNSLKPVA
jgi:hypothetical protein